MLSRPICEAEFEYIHWKTLSYRIKHETGNIAAQWGGQGSSVSSIVFCAGYMSWFCVLCCVQGIDHAKSVCFVFWYKAWSWITRWESVDFFDFVFTRYLGITKNHMKIMGQHLVIFPIENPCISLTLFLHIIWASPKFI
jgi:hypothetical protein